MMAAQRQWIHLQKQLLPFTKEPASLNTNYARNALRRHREAIETALKRGHLKLLNRRLILDSQLRSEGCAAASELEYVQRISLDRCHVQALDDFDLLSCVRLRICNLESCYVSDIGAFYGCVSLLKLDLTNNQITVLPPNEFWSSLSSLRVLYLGDNAISGKSSLSRLNGCPQLHILTLNNTPLSLIKNYRHHVVNSIMSLRALDSHVISDEEIIENLHLEEPFQPMTATFRLPLYQSYSVGTSLKEEVRGVYSLLLRVDKVMAKYSPVTLIQRWTRGWLVRKALLKSKDPSIKALVLRKLGIASSDQETHSSADQILPPSSHSPSLCKTVAAQVPTVSGSRSLRRQKSSTPPPPPTTPRRNKMLSLSVDTHILGVDCETLQLRYSMCIDLNKLQKAVAVAESSELSGINKTFRKAFVTKPPSCNKQDSYKGNEFEEESSRNAEEQANHDNISKNGINQSSEEIMGLAGQAAEVLTHDQLPSVAISKKEDGKTIRAAEKEISDAVERIRQPPQRVRQLRPKPMSKEHHSFTRAYATMTLSALKSIEKMQEARKKGEELMRKAKLVSKVKQERVIRQSKIEEHQRVLRENILEWKSDEMQRLEDARNKQNQQHQKEVLKRSRVHDDGIISMQKLIENQEFASEFSRQNTLIGGTLSKEDRKASRDSAQSMIKEHVQLAKKLSAEQQELVKKHMESRKALLIREGAEAKKELNIKTLEAISQRMMDAKRKVAKEVARKEAARMAIEEVKREIRCGPQGPGEQRPAPHGSTVRRENDQDVRHRREDLLGEFARKQSAHTSPAHVRRMNFEAHKTWQRGAEAMEEAKNGTHHFPILPANSRSAMMYEMMAPGLVLKSDNASPLTSSDIHSDIDNANSGNSNNVMLISQYQPVR